MECPYFEAGTVRRVCNASLTRLAPDTEKACNYCTTEEHYRCPMLLAHVLRGGGVGKAAGFTH